ncbi:hypothetical protein AK812_SmicGene28055 [Symbiodinium microadriaticum]|uniref:Uncharacterized protein n=1 Tax=Symbiodinium microadriaticum TaxID=2951 RepID=A0A1Q9D5D6_SYMMI|nr:hypothetical protein AK812_SmicGene28055 [Symbiodinium microadriaticum]
MEKCQNPMWLIFIIIIIIIIIILIIIIIIILIITVITTISMIIIAIITIMMDSRWVWASSPAQAPIANYGNGPSLNKQGYS